MLSLVYLYLLLEMIWVLFLHFQRDLLINPLLVYSPYAYLLKSIFQYHKASNLSIYEKEIYNFQKEFWKSFSWVLKWTYFIFPNKILKRIFFLYNPVVLFLADMYEKSTPGVHRDSSIQLRHSPMPNFFATNSCEKVKRTAELQSRNRPLVPNICVSRKLL